MHMFPRFSTLTSSVNREYGGEGSSYPIGPQGFLALLLARYLRLKIKDEDFVVLLVLRRSAERVGDPTPYARHNFLGRLHNFFALPEGYAEQLASLSIAQDDKPLEPVQLLELR